MKKRVLLFQFLLIVYLLLFQTLFLIAAELSGITEDLGEKGSSGLWSDLAGDFDYSLRMVPFGSYIKVADSSQNPGNDFLKIPSYDNEFQFRLDTNLDFQRLYLSLKPRIILEWRKWDDGARRGDTEWEDQLFINEWLVRLSVTRDLFFSYGRENLQWGPSYLFSPSNPFFRDNGRSNPKIEVPGMDFARVVWCPNMSWTFSFISNLDEGRQEFLFNKFEKINALKIDFTGQEGYAGMIFSRKENDRNRLGFFGGRTATDALLLYGEGVISEGTNALYPRADNSPLGASMLALEDDSSSLKNTILLGASYTLRAGPNLVMEYVYNEPGYGDDQAKAYYQLRKNAADAFNLTGPIQDLSGLTLSKTMDPQLSFLRRNYIMFQYNHNDIKDVLNIIFRWTLNVDDGSDQFISIVEYFYGDHIQLFSIGSINSGSGDTEFGTIFDYQWMIGLEYTF
ncbi:MAG: hypothetical protein ACMUHX_01470 [bacterium]